MFSFALPFPLGLRCDFGLAGLKTEALGGTQSSTDSTTGRGVPGAPPGVLGIRFFFHRVFADSGVLMAL